MRSCNVMRCVNCSRVFCFLCFCLRWCLYVAFCLLWFVLLVGRCLWRIRWCACVGVRFDVASTCWFGPTSQLHYILACHYELHFGMVLFISGVCLRCSGASLGLSVSSARILPMLPVWLYNCILAFVVALSHLIAYQFEVLVFALVWSPGIRYVERIAVAAWGPVPVFVGVCGLVACIFLFVVVGCARVGCIAALVAANVSTRRRFVRLHFCEAVSTSLPRGNHG